MVAAVFGFGRGRRLPHISFALVLVGYLVSFSSKGIALVRPSLLPVVFVAFNLFLYAGIYILNDIVDLPFDRLHPTKRSRPVASGELPVPLAWLLALVLIASGLGVGFVLSPQFGLWECLFLGLNVLYTVALKRVRYVDLAVSTVTYPLRVLLGIVLAGGAPADHLPIIFSAAAFVWTATTLRRHAELTRVGQHARPVLRQYQTRHLFWLALLPGLAWPLLLARPCSPVEKGVASFVAVLWVVVAVLWTMDGSGALRRLPRLQSTIRWLSGL